MIQAQQLQQNLMVLVTKQRAMYKVDLETLKFKPFSQKICKYEPLFLQKHGGDVVIFSQSNEIIVLNEEDDRSRKQSNKVQNEITQVKKDFYASQYKADSLWLGADQQVAVTEKQLVWIEFE